MATALRRPQPFRWTLIFVIGAVAGILQWLGAVFLNPKQPCGEIGQCLGVSFRGLGLIFVAAPLVVLVGMYISHFRWRDILIVPLFVAATLGFYGVLEWTGSHEGNRFPWAWLPFALAAVVAGWLAVRQRRTPTWLRIVPIALLATALIGGNLWGNAEVRRRGIEEILMVPVTYYLPDFGEGTTLQQTYGSTLLDAVGLWYSLPGEDGANDSIAVELVPVDFGGGPCAVMAERYFVDEDPACLNSGVAEVASLGSTAFAVVREDTLLLAEVPDGTLTREQVVDALNNAPAVSAEELYAAGH